jgi:hypothetical protein
LRQRARHGRRRAAQPASRGGEAAGFEDCEQHGKLVQAIHPAFHLAED